EANDFEHLVDSPFLFGDLTVAETTVGSTTVAIYNYSADGAINASTLLNDLTEVLNSADEFLQGIPVDRYTFLFHYGEFTSGAWEHSYSSEYVLKTYNASQVKSIGAHEFFHVVTPLNIHSEIIEDFNFITPTPSKHLWLYEGVTEWASHTMLFRAGNLSEESYINNAVEYKVSIDRTYYDATFTLVDIALQSYSTEGQKQYGNIYYRGSLVASLLDIRLLELSNGTYGLRELMLELIDTYGADQPFSEETFFETIEVMTYPEIGDFINSYIINAQPLPYAEYFGKLGYNVADDGSRPVITPISERTASQQLLYNSWKQNL
ncbi:MAG TPA: peptidase, partial [Chryseosolibacter sp.]|nr:peptidase [Chryseosolibacter sp.]